MTSFPQKFTLGLLLMIVLITSAITTFLYGQRASLPTMQLSDNQSLLPVELLNESPPPDPSITGDSDTLADPFRSTLASFFWVGETADDSNGFISNTQSSWDATWLESFGGVDDPNNRCGYKPCGFVPKENPFYFALPYNDLNSNGQRKATAVLIPWFTDKQHLKSVLKNAWIEVLHQDKVCYAQWQDVGPFETDDFEYVFGTANPSNQRGEKAGLDLSPAVRDCLGMVTNGVVSWRFIEESAVPEGPWLDIVTTTDVNW